MRYAKIDTIENVFGYHFGDWVVAFCCIFSRPIRYFPLDIIFYRCCIGVAHAYIILLLLEETQRGICSALGNIQDIDEQLVAIDS